MIHLIHIFRRAGCIHARNLCPRIVRFDYTGHYEYSLRCQSKLFLAEGMSTPSCSRLRKPEWKLKYKGELYF